MGITDINYIFEIYSEKVYLSCHVTAINCIEAGIELKVTLGFSSNFHRT